MIHLLCGAFEHYADVRSFLRTIMLIAYLLCFICKHTNHLFSQVQLRVGNANKRRIQIHLMKRVAIIYESLYGNTRQIAEEIRDGLRESGNIEVRLANPGGIHTDKLCDYDIILFGSPNHNQAPTLNIMKYIDRVSIVGLENKFGAVFDTYTGGNEGIATKKLEKTIKEKIPGITLVIDGVSFKVSGRKGPLIEGETERARQMGRTLREKIPEE
ncbi:MAG: hypothetical protein GF411_08025 [Candidatus Lokiarchaeota archaeon]|nr:hypothetical protein [Candidatus Lokiarchaeota archaeon]